MFFLPCLACLACDLKFTTLNWYCYTVLQRHTAATAYFSSEQLLLFALAFYYIKCSMWQFIITLFTLSAIQQAVQRPPFVKGRASVIWDFSSKRPHFDVYPVRKPLWQDQCHNAISMISDFSYLCEHNWQNVGIHSLPFHKCRSRPPRRLKARRCFSPELFGIIRGQMIPTDNAVLQGH